MYLCIYIAAKSHCTGTKLQGPVPLRYCRTEIGKQGMQKKVVMDHEPTHLDALFLLASLLGSEWHAAGVGKDGY